MIRHPISAPICRLLAITLFVLVNAIPLTAGAHGPEGDHAHAPSATGEPLSGQPAIEAHTEMFELVGTLTADELSVMVDRYATNEPVLDGTLEVEFGGIKAQGKLHADAGDYAFTDAALLRALRSPGAHPLVFTLIAGQDSDLIEGTLNVVADEHEHAPRLPGSLWMWIGLLGLAGVAAVVIWRLRRRNILQKDKA
jgi:hypothetical protein